MRVNGRPRKSTFDVVRFVNPSGQRVWRVTGNADGKRIRENFPSEAQALERRRELENEHATPATDPETLRATTLSREQLGEAEAAWRKLAQAEAGLGSLLGAVEHWLKARAAGELTPVAVYWNDATQAFLEWVDATPSLRPRTRANLKSRLSRFTLRAGNRPLHEVDADLIERWLASRKVSPRSMMNDKLALSRLLSWCVERPRKWIPTNPVAQVRVEVPESGEPPILTLPQVRTLLEAARNHRGGRAKVAGRLVPYLVASLWAGIRPGELARLKWEQLDLAGGTIRVRQAESKTGPPRVVELPANLLAWLQWCQKRGLTSFKAVRKEFDVVRAKAGLLESWPDDVLRHTAVSHHVRKHGSFALTALAMGNSEAVIRKHYHARVTSQETKDFFDILP